MCLFILFQSLNGCLIHSNQFVVLIKCGNMKQYNEINQKSKNALFIALNYLLLCNPDVLL